GRNKVPFEIKPDLAIDVFQTLPDGQPNPNYGSLYEVWSRFYPAGQFPGEPTAVGGSDILFAVSHDAGQTWEIPSRPQAGTGVPAPTLSTNHFRPQNVRAIAADPLRPGVVYAAEAAEHTDAFGNVLDEGDVNFARSTDYGATWRTTFQVAGNTRAKALNDDN